MEENEKTQAAGETDKNDNHRKTKKRGMEFYKDVLGSPKYYVY